VKKWTSLFLLSLLTVVFLFGLQGSRQVVGFKKLQEFLPKIDLAGFTRQKPAGETSSPSTWQPPKQPWLMKKAVATI
jgi:hypothetical protein